MAFKSVEWVRAVRDKHHEETKGMSFQKRQAFYKAKAEVFCAKLKRRKTGSSGKP